MTRPVFFSMGGEKDGAFAKQVKDLLPDNMVYFYRRTGVEGVPFRGEIETELQSCRLLVVFWSEDYLASEAAKLELAFYRRLVEGQGHGNREVLVVPVRPDGPNIQEKWTNPITQKEDDFILGRWRLDRALDPAPDPQKVADQVLRKMERSNLSGRVLVSRPSVIEDIKRAVEMPGYQAHEFLFVVGFEGNGRRTALRQYMSSSYGNLTERAVGFDSSEGPEDLLLRMLESSGVAAKAREEIIASIKAGITTAIKELRKVVHEARAGKSYFVLTLDRFAAVDTVGVPFWVTDAFVNFGAGNAPLVFLVTSNPVSDELLAHFPKAGRVRVPGLDEKEMGELVHRLSLEDREPQRWTAEAKAKVVAASGGSPSLCQTIMYAMVSGGSMDFLDVIAKREEESFSANMSALLQHIISRFQNRRNEVLALKVIERLGLTSKTALDEILEPITQGSYNLYELLEYGLLERLSDGIYRIPPLIQRRLGFLLLDSFQDENLDALFARFAQKVMVTTDDYGTVYATNKILSGLRSGADAPGLGAYLTTAMLFKVGIERYSSENYVHAHSLLSRAMDKLDEKGTVVDASTQVEIARYFGLASARVKAENDVQRACGFLSQRFAGSGRARQASAIAKFVKGFELRVKSEANKAIPEFESAIDLLEGVRRAERQRGAILTELSRAYLLRKPPNCDRAVSAAQRAYGEKQTVHNLSGLIRALIQRLIEEDFDDRKFEAHVKDIRTELALLDEMSRRTGSDFALIRLSDLERVIILRLSERQGLPVNLSVPIRLIDEAHELRRRDQTQAQGWMLRLADQGQDHGSRVLAEAQRVLDNPTRYLPSHVDQAVKAKIVVLARTSRSAALSVLQQHQSSLTPGPRAYLKNVIDQRGIIPPTNKGYMELSRA